MGRYFNVTPAKSTSSTARGDCSSVCPYEICDQSRLNARQSVSADLGLEVSRIYASSVSLPAGLLDISLHSCTHTQFIISFNYSRKSSTPKARNQTLLSTIHLYDKCIRISLIPASY